MLMLFVEETELAADVCPTPDPLPAPALRLATAAKVSRRLTADISEAVKLGSDTLMLDVEDLSDEADVSIWNIQNKFLFLPVSSYAIGFWIKLKNFVIFTYRKFLR